MTTIAKLTAAIGLIAALAACNTVQGVGRDIKGGGEALTGTAKDVQAEL